MEGLLSVVFAACIAVLVYILYISGYIQIKSTRALMYIGEWGNSFKNYHKARLSSCSGYIRRVIRLNENREYNFSLSPEITNGSVTVNIIDPRKNTVLSLDESRRHGVIRPGESSGYRLVIKYEKAGGSYELNWE